jgi:Flp pilus assembly pilin Flp
MKLNTLKTSQKLNTLKKLKLKKPRGQGMTEYIIIVALIAIAAIGVITLFGDNIRALFGQSANALAGETTVTKRTNVSKDKMEKKGLKDFSEHNSAGY